MGSLNELLEISDFVKVIEARKRLSASAQKSEKTKKRSASERGEFKPKTVALPTSLKFSF